MDVYFVDFLLMIPIGVIFSIVCYQPIVICSLVLQLTVNRLAGRQTSTTNICGLNSPAS